MESYKVEESGCWQWLGEDDGEFPLTPEGRNARLAVWRKESGTIPDGMWVVNTCGNPLCVAPAHQKLRLPTTEEAAAWSAKKAVKNAAEVDRKRAELESQLPKTLADYEAYTTKWVPHRDGPTCWNWNLGFSKDGYPTLPGVNDTGGWLEVNVAHKVMELASKPRPPSTAADAMVLKRVCKNKKCINPLHLQWVTRASMQAANYAGSASRQYSKWRTYKRSY